MSEIAEIKPARGRTTTVTLKHGLKIGESVEKVAEVREATAGDVLSANERAEKLMPGGFGSPVLVSSPTMAAFHVLCAQVRTIGGTPVTPELIRKLHPEDYQILQQAADSLESAAIASETEERGRNDPGQAGN